MITLAILWSGLLLYLPPPTSLACSLGKEAECHDATFVPGSDLAGEGFDMTKMQRLGTFVINMSKWQLKNNTCNLSKNPFMQDKKQKLLVSVIYWRVTQNCSRSLSSSVHESSESLVCSGTSSRYSTLLTEITGGHAQDTALLFSSSNDPGAYNQWLSPNPKYEHLRRAICDYILQRALWRNCSTPCKAGIATNPKEPCECSCHNNPAVKANCCPAQLRLAQISVSVMKVTGLWGDYFSQTDGYVKVLRDHKVLLGETSFGGLSLEVWDRYNKWDDDLLGACNIQLKARVKSDFCRLGLLYYKMAITCGPSLAGSSCTEYVGFPMSSHLEKIYVSRHARAIPKDVLVKMGVLLNERRFLFSQTSDLKSKAQTL
uniref:Perforin 1.9 n=1 Tax=Cyprinus carpio TaxID=7962 RepID=A0A8C1ULH4_CYPCA